MKTLVRKDGNISIYLFADDVTIVVGDSSTQVSGTIPLIITDCNQSNILLFENVMPPDDWNFHKYLYEAGVWTLNPQWVDPAQVTV
jgi:hypothetical protein